MKSGKQIKVNDNKNYSIIYGCVDNKNPKSIYINISAWAEPLSDYEGDYNKIIKNINKKIRQTVYNYLSKNNTEITVVIPEIDKPIWVNGWTRFPSKGN
jgi:phenylpyruvate tautomerase PptA (4-oxalocrotonate tautomerase family)